MASKKPKPQESETPSFEESLSRLEQIVQELEGGDIALSDALVRYEEGVKLFKSCYELLEGAEARIELLSGVDADGNPVLNSFDEDPEENIHSTETSTRRARGKKTAGKKASTAKAPKQPKDTDVDTSGSLF